MSIIIKPFKTMKLISTVILFASFSITFTAMGQGERKYIRHGNKQYDNQDYKSAEIDYRKSLVKDASSLPGRFNLGDAMYRQKNYQEAIQAFDTLRNSKADKDVLSKAYYNLGNSLLNFAMDSAGRQTQALPASIEAYKNALRYDPTDMDAKYNLAYALKQVQQQQQQQQNQQQNDNKDQKKDQQQQQNQQKQDQQQAQQDQQQSQQDQQQSQQDQQQGQQGQARQLSKEDAARMLEALQNDEKNTIEKLREKNIKAVRVKIDKNW
jgi:septal ring factor EnvC (AmiA/AmiB activator)